MLASGGRTLTNKGVEMQYNTLKVCKRLSSFYAVSVTNTCPTSGDLKGKFPAYQDTISFRFIQCYFTLCWAFLLWSLLHIYSFGFHAVTCCIFLLSPTGRTGSERPSRAEGLMSTGLILKSIPLFSKWRELQQLD